MPNEIHVPPAVAAWVDVILYVFLGLVLVWAGLKVAGIFMRRAYNLTPVGTARSKDVKPDFLKVDHGERERLIDRGREFDKARELPVKKALSAAGFGAIASAILSLVSAAFFALGRIRDYDEIWRDLSARDRFSAIVQSHPVGFGIAVFIIVSGAVVKFVPTFRPQK